MCDLSITNSCKTQFLYQRYVLRNGDTLWKYRRRSFDLGNQQDATTFSFINPLKSALHVSGDKFAHPQEHFFDCIYDFWYNAPTLAPDRCRS